MFLGMDSDDTRINIKNFIFQADKFDQLSYNLPKV